VAGRRLSAPSGSSLSSADSARIVIPSLNKDPVWSLRPWPVTVTFAGKDFEIPALFAADWLAYLLQPVPDLDGLINDLLPGAEDLLYDLELDPDQLYEICLELIGMVSARPWWVVFRQITVAAHSWHILGAEMALAHIDATKVSLALWLDTLLVLTIRAMDPKDVTMFVMKLEAVPADVPGTPPVEEMEMSRDSFLSLAMKN